MRIAFGVEGGIASFPGLRRPVTIDCDALPAEQAARLRALVERTRSAAAPTAPRPGAADTRTYTVEIDDGRECRTLRIPEPVVDQDLRALVDELRQCARNRR
jgi:hypothetical protein